VVHPFHPWFGRDLEFVKRRRNWRADRVYVFDDAGELVSLPVEWTDLALADPCVVVAAAGNSSNGHRPKTVITDVGPVEITGPRDREPSSGPKSVAKRQRRLTGVDELLLIPKRRQCVALGPVTGPGILLATRWRSVGDEGFGPGTEGR
jgi:hypothetical protein